MNRYDRARYPLAAMAILAAAACSDAPEAPLAEDAGMADMVFSDVDAGPDEDLGESPFGCDTCTVFVGKYFDGTDFVQGAVAVDGDTIHSVTDVVPSALAGTRQDIEGTLIPGLFDLHTHMIAHGGLDSVGYAFSPTAFRALLRAGVTTTLDLGSAAPVAFEFRRRIAEGEQVGPRLFVTGPLVTAYGGHPAGHAPQDTSVIFIDKEADVARLEPLLAQDPDLVKIVLERGAEPDEPATRVRIDAALLDDIVGALGDKSAIAHVGSRQDVLDALDAGIRIFGHIPSFDRFEPADIERLVRERAVIVPTLVVAENYEMLASGERHFLEGIDESDVHPELIETFDSQPDVPPELRARFERRVDNMRANFVAVREAGITIAAGTDAGNGGTLHGPSMWQELATYVELGMSTSEALATATSVAADTLRVSGGRLAAGEPADLVLVSGDIEADIGALYDITAVYKLGVAQDLDALAGTSNDYGEVDPPRDLAEGERCYTRNECGEGLDCAWRDLECHASCNFFQRCENPDDVCTGALGQVGACQPADTCDPFAAEDECEYGACRAGLGGTSCAGYGEGGEGDDCSRGCAPGYQCDQRNNRCAQLCDTAGNMSTCPDGQTCDDILWNTTPDLGYCV